MPSRCKVSHKRFALWLTTPLSRYKIHRNQHPLVGRGSLLKLAPVSHFSWKETTILVCRHLSVCVLEPHLLSRTVCWRVEVVKPPLCLGVDKQLLPPLTQLIIASCISMWRSHNKRQHGPLPIHGQGNIYILSFIAFISIDCFSLPKKTTPKIFQFSNLTVNSNV